MAENRDRVGAGAMPRPPSERSSIASFIVMDVMQAAAAREAAGHRVAVRVIVPDEPEPLREFLGAHAGRCPGALAVDAILVTGGTGISPRDRTYEAVSALLTKTIPGFGELFRMLSYQEIGPACMLSRAVGGLLDSTVVLVMPGSRAAVELAMTKIILPELPHLVREARKR